MRRIICALCALLVCITLGGCGRDETADHMFFAMDTLITLRLSRDADDARMAEIFAGAEAIVTEIEKNLSRTIPDSDTSRFNNSASGIADAGIHFRAVTERALAIARETEGAFSPTMGTLSALWNITGGGPVPADSAISEALSHADFRCIAVTDAGIIKNDSGIQFDPGAIGKGYAAQKLIDYFRGTEIRWGLVSLGGNVGVFGEKPDGTPFKIGLTDPTDTSRTAGYLLAEDGFVSVSGDYERYFEADGVRYHHIMDPATGRPAESGLSSAAVISADGTLADALSTALFVMGADKALAYYDAHPGTFEAVLITKKNEIILTPGLAAGGGFIPAQ